MGDPSIEGSCGDGDDAHDRQQQKGRFVFHLVLVSFDCVCAQFADPDT